MSKETQIYFSDLPSLTQQNILDQYGASCAADLGLDTLPYATINVDNDGVAALGISKLALRTA